MSSVFDRSMESSLKKYGLNSLVSMYTCGQCHALALALHEQAGLPLMGLSTLPYPESTPSHVVVGLPDGTLFDIQGPLAELRWAQCTSFPLTKGAVEGLHRRDYSRPRMEDARVVAKALLRRNRTYLANLGITPFKGRREPCIQTDLF